MASITDFSGGHSGRETQWMLHFLISLTIVVVAGGYAVWQIMTLGHAAFNTTNAGIFWGLPIVLYDYFLLTSTGLVMVAAIYHVLGVEAFRPVAKRCLGLALAGLMGGVAVLFLELSNPLMALWATPLNMQTQSPLFWKILLVGAYTVLLAIVLFNSIKQPTVRPNPLVWPLALLALAITLVAGSVYGMMAMRPMWFGGEIPVVFLIESLVGALAFTMVFSHLAHGFRHDRMSDELRWLFEGPLARLFGALIALHFLLHAGRAITGWWSNAEGLQVWDYMLSGPLFYIGLGVCTLVPLVLMLLPATRSNGLAQVTSGLLVMIGLFIARYEFIIGGQQVPLFKGSWVQTQLIEYTPSMTEWALLGLGIGIANMVYGFAAWQLGGEDEA